MTPIRLCSVANVPLSNALRQPKSDRSRVHRPLRARLFLPPAKHLGVRFCYALRKQEIYLVQRIVMKAALACH